MNILFVVLMAISVRGQSIAEQIEVHFGQSGHTNNWAVLVCASRYWYNYRHIANTLSVYRSVKRLGIPGLSMTTWIIAGASGTLVGHIF